MAAYGWLLPAAGRRGSCCVFVPCLSANFHLFFVSQRVFLMSAAVSSDVRTTSAARAAGVSSGGSGRLLTRETADRLQGELHHLRTVVRPELVELVLHARDAGDISENTDYRDASKEQQLCEARIEQLEGLLASATVVDGPVQSDVVVEGVQFTVVFIDGPQDAVAADDLAALAAAAGSSDAEQFLFGQVAERRSGVDVVSPESPLGRQVAGASVGDVVTFKAPAGVQLSVQVLQIGE